MAALINKAYLEPKIIEKLGEGFKNNNPKGIQLTSFLESKLYSSFLKQISNAKFKKNEIREVHSFFEAKNADLSIFNSKEFLYFCSILSGKILKKAECSLRMLMHGSYTLIHEETAKEGIEFFFDLTPRWNDGFGGNITYLSYDGSKVVTPQCTNTLILAEGGRSYVKYVNHLAKSEGRLIIYGRLK